MENLTWKDKEDIAKEWIRDNSHQAVVEAIKVHMKYTFRCECIVKEITPLIIKQYPNNFIEEEK